MKYIVEKKVSDAVKKHGNFKNALRHDGIPDNKYQFHRDKIMKIIGRKIKELKA